MSKFQLTIIGATIAELQASAAEFASFGGAVSSVSVIPTTLQPGHAPMNMASDDDDGDDKSAAGALDAAGIPWDERIHSGGKNKTNADGTWRRKRNVHDTTYNTVMDELRARKSSAPAPTTAAPPAYTPPPSVVIPPASAPMVAPPMMTAPPQAGAPAPQQQPAPVAAGMAFGDFMPRLSQSMSAGKFSNEQLTQALAQFGLQTVGQLQPDPVKTLEVYNTFRGWNWMD